MDYTTQQIEAVRKMQSLMKIPGELSDEACVEFLDFWHSTCSAEARGITSIDQARKDILENDESFRELKFRKLVELSNLPTHLLVTQYRDRCFADREAELFGFSEPVLDWLTEQKILYSALKEQSTCPQEVLARSRKKVYKFR